MGPEEAYAGATAPPTTGGTPVLRFLGLLLAVWLVITVAGAVIKGLFWLAVVGLIFFVATAAIGWNKRNNKALPRGW
jgi:hypothetical protein